MPEIQPKMTQNQITYGSAGIVKYYGQINYLQPAEQVIIDRLAARLPTMKMLDIGVGAGRTTPYFCDRTADYIGIDSSSEMIEACQKRFPDRQFQVCDARDMSCFETGSFDFILFSFNGIDYVSHLDRLKIIQEIHRISKQGAVFYFSSHNLQEFETAFNFKSQWSCNPILSYTNLVMCGILRWMNRPLTLTQLRGLSHTIVKDESHQFRLNTYYIRPQEQIKQLNAQFENIQAYSWKQGTELTTLADQVANLDQWIYYYCTTKA